MKEILLKVAAVLCVSAVVFGAVMYATSAETWYAGQHTNGCDGSQSCDCCKKLISAENAQER